MGSGNYLVDMMDNEKERPSSYCSDCQNAPCICDELYEIERDLED